MLHLVPGEVPTPELHGYLLGAIGPRPIALASTMDREGNPNLAPFSFFNIFGTRPPTLVFSPSRRVRDNTSKHTLENVLATMEVVINVVSYAMVYQTSLASTEYGMGVNEFEKAGFGMMPSDRVRPYRVAESPVQIECRVKRVESLGDEGGSGNLVVCEVAKLHVARNVLDPQGAIDPFKLDQVARLGGEWYTRARSGLFEVEKPLTTIGLGVDALPKAVRESKILTGNDLGRLGNVTRLPTRDEVADFLDEHPDLKVLVAQNNKGTIHKKAQQLLSENELGVAWNLLMAMDYQNLE